MAKVDLRRTAVPVSVPASGNHGEESRAITAPTVRGSTTSAAPAHVRQDGSYQAINGQTFPIRDGKILIPVSLIRPMPGQPRRHFDPAELRSLAASIGATEQAQPVQAHPLDEPDEQGRLFELIDGERRYRAVKLLQDERPEDGPQSVACILKYEPDPVMRYELAVAANHGRAEHTVLETADIVLKLTEHGKDPAHIARLLSVTVQSIDNYARLNRLIPTVRQYLGPEYEMGKRLSMFIGMRIASFPTEHQAEAGKRVGLGGIVVPQTVALSRLDAFLDELQSRARAQENGTQIPRISSPSLSRSLPASSRSRSRGRPVAGDMTPEAHFRGRRKAIMNMIEETRTTAGQIGRMNLPEIFHEAPADRDQALALIAGCISDLEGLAATIRQIGQVVADSEKTKPGPRGK